MPLQSNVFNAYHFWLLAAWLGYVFFHSFLASAKVKGKMQSWMGNRYPYYRLSYSIFAATTLALILLYQFTNESPLLYRPATVYWLIGGLGGAAGLAGMAVCIRKYFMNLSGVDVLLKEKREPVLEVGGLHQYVRHPLYSSTLLFCWSLFVVFPYVDNLLACAVITVYTLFGIGLEERKLVEEFGPQYTTYAATTPMLIPGMPTLSEKKRA